MTVYVNLLYYVMIERLVNFIAQVITVNEGCINVEYNSLQSYNRKYPVKVE